MKNRGRWGLVCVSPGLDGDLLSDLYEEIGEGGVWSVYLLVLMGTLTARLLRWFGLEKRGLGGVRCQAEPVFTASHLFVCL